MELIKELRLLGRHQEAKSMLKSYHKQIKEQRLRDRKESIRKQRSKDLMEAKRTGKCVYCKVESITPPLKTRCTGCQHKASIQEIERIAQGE